MTDDLHVLRDYALVADGERGGVVGPHGDIVWLCAPRWDSPSIFSVLAGGVGTYRVTPRGRYVWGGHYEDGTLIWRNRWVTENGIVECRDALAYPGDRHRIVLVRRITPVDTAADVDVVLRPRADYDQHRLREVSSLRGVWSARCGELWMRWGAGAGVRHDGDALKLHAKVDLGQHRDLVLEISSTPLADQPPDPDEVWHATEANWQGAVPRPSGVLAPRDTGHSLAVLHGLTSRTGGMVAAATTSLPERSDEGRNYDYRYVWVRDQCFAGHAAAAVGDDSLLDSATRFVVERLLEHGDRLAPAYTVDGGRVPAQRRIGLPGYPGGYDQMGNDAGSQFQLDAYGDALLLLAEAAQRGRLDGDGRRAAAIARDTIGERHAQPDSGIWEIEPRLWTHSRLMAVAGLRAWARAGDDVSNGAAELRLADSIAAQASAGALHRTGRWQRAVDDPAVDAALLFPGIRGAFAPDDPRTAATVAAVQSELVADGYAYRFRHDGQPLGEAEGSFLLCGFALCLALSELGQPVAARAWFERTTSATGSAGLFSEEFDVGQRQLRGNLPQAFVHALMVESAARLASDNAAPASSWR